MKSIISLVIFATVAIIAWWSTIGLFDEDDLPPAQSARYVEIFMNEFEMVSMNDTGTPAYKLNGKQLERYNDSNDSIIKQPIVRMLEPESQWIVSADFATLNDENNTIRLNDNVVMQQQNIEPAVTIRTQSMLIHTETQIAQTDARVNFTQGNSKLTSTGMIYNNRTSELELTSSVSGYHQPYD